MGVPTGTVSFLFTDIENSTRMWEQNPEAMRVSLAEHDALLHGLIARHNGHVFKTIGDAFCAAFQTAPEAVNAAFAIQLALHQRLKPDQELPIRDRMGIHTGNTDERDGDYFGPTVNRVARLMSIGHGGQLLLSDITQSLVANMLPPGASLIDMGNHRLKDLQQPEHVWQFCHPGLTQEFPPLRSLNNSSNNLPVQTTSFIGREGQIAEVKQLLKTTRLLTLTGAGGSGKTRLALQVAADLLGGEMTRDGVWLVEFAPLSDPALVPQTLATVLNVSEEPGRPLTQTLSDYLKNKKMLLVLDNCEHVLSEVARLSDLLMRACPEVKIIASSREGLAIQGESVFKIPSLSMPSLKRRLTAEQLYQYEAVKLFIERATAVSPAFTVTNQNAPALAQVCNHLDGIPLAIELAAARVRAMPIDQIATRLSDRFRLLTGGSRTALPRQQTLRALIDWSYDLLNEQEKALLCRLSVFAGGCTLEAAEATCAGDLVEDWEILDFLTSLVDKSLVVYEEMEGAGRYRMLETIRQYSADRLRESGEADAVRTKHRDWFLALAEQARDKLTGPEQAQWLETLETENDNLRSAFDFSLENMESADEALRMVDALWRFWYNRGYRTEGRERCARALAHPHAGDYPKLRALALARAGTIAMGQSDYTAARELAADSLKENEAIQDRAGAANALNLLGAIAWSQGEYETARKHYEACLALRRELSDPAGLAMTLGNLGNVNKDLDNYEEARKLQEECLAVQKRIGNKFGMAIALGNLGVVERDQENVARARQLLDQSLTIHRELGNQHGIAMALVNLGPLFCKEGDLNQSFACLKECLDICQEIGAKRESAFALEGCAMLAAAHGQTRRAVTLYGASEGLREAIESPIPPFEQKERDSLTEKLHADLGEAVYRAEWTAGHQLSWEDALTLAQENPVAE